MEKISFSWIMLAFAFIVVVGLAFSLDRTGNKSASSGNIRFVKDHYLPNQKMTVEEFINTIIER